MKGIDHSYYYEGYYVFKTEELSTDGSGKGKCATVYGYASGYFAGKHIHFLVMLLRQT